MIPCDQLSYYLQVLSQPSVICPSFHKSRDVIASVLAPEDSCSERLFLAATHCSLVYEVSLTKLGARSIQCDIEHQPVSKEQRRIMRSFLPPYRMGMDHPGSSTTANNMARGEQEMLSATVIDLVKSRRSS